MYKNKFHFFLSPSNVLGILERVLESRSLHSAGVLKRSNFLLRINMYLLVVFVVLKNVQH